VAVAEQRHDRAVAALSVTAAVLAAIADFAITAQGLRASAP